MASYEGCHLEGDWLVICVGPDVCKTISGTPVPYATVAYGRDSTAVSGNVQFKATGAFNSPSFTICCVNNEPGVSGGVKSGVNIGVCYEATHSSTVNINNAPAIRDGDVFWVNARSRKAPGNTLGIVKYLTGAVLAEFAEALKEGTDAWVNVLETIDPRLGDALRAPPQQLDEQALKDFWKGLKEGAAGQTMDELEEQAGGAVGGVLDRDVFSGRKVGDLGSKIGELGTKVANTKGDIDDFLDKMSNRKQAEALGEIVGKVTIGFLIQAAKKRLGTLRVRKKGPSKSSKPSAAAKKKSNRKIQQASRRANRPKK